MQLINFFRSFFAQILIMTFIFPANVFAAAGPTHEEMVEITKTFNSMNDIKGVISYLEKAGSPEAKELKNFLTKYEITPNTKMPKLKMDKGTFVFTYEKHPFAINNFTGKSFDLVMKKGMATIPAGMDLESIKKMIDETMLAEGTKTSYMKYFIDDANAFLPVLVIGAMVAVVGMLLHRLLQITGASSDYLIVLQEASKAMPAECRYVKAEDAQSLKAKLLDAEKSRAEVCKPENEKNSSAKVQYECKVLESKISDCVKVLDHIAFKAQGKGLPSGAAGK